MIAIGSDHGGFALKEEIKKHLDENKIPYEDFGTYQNTRMTTCGLSADCTEKTCASNYQRQVRQRHPLLWHRHWYFYGGQ